MKRLIVNADDYGRTAGINQGTIDAHLRGIVSSTTVMILESAAAEGIELALRTAPRLSLGIHCVLTGGGPPASPAGRLKTLAPAGVFARNAEALPETIDPEEVRAELSAQIERFESLAGRPPSHLDSHHHSALHPSIQPIFAAIAAERGLPVRASSPAAAAALRDHGLRVPDRFLDGFYAEGATVENLLALISDLPQGTSELMCHPGYPDAALLAGSTYARERVREVDALCDPSVRARLADRGVDLVAFDAL
ncbi:MAG: ChbG/HpnK family deacetylase [Acidobacteriota bacterium]